MTKQNILVLSAVIVTFVITVVAIVGTGAKSLDMLFPDWQERRQNNRVLDSDPDALLSACREILSRRGEFRPFIAHSFGDSNAPTLVLHEGEGLADAPLPRRIRALRPRNIYISSNSVAVDVTNPFNPFGFEGFAEGMVGTGAVKIQDGLWLFHDGQLSGEKAGRAQRRMLANRVKP